MPLALRITQNNLIWEISSDEKSWLDENDIPADPVTDLKTQENSLSVWILQDNKSQLDRCLSAYAANRTKLEKLDYVLFDESIINKLNLNCHSTQSTLKDQEINQLHKDISELSANKIVNLAKMILANCERGRKIKNDVAKLINESIQNNWIRKESLSDDFINEIKKILNKP